MSRSYNWEIDQEKQSRIYAFEQWLLKFFDDYADTQDSAAGALRKFSQIVRKQKADDALAPELDGFFNNSLGEEFEKYVADFYFHPIAAQNIPNKSHHYSSKWNFIVPTIQGLCELALARVGKDYAFEQALGRLNYQLHNPESELELSIPKWKLAEIALELEGLSPEQAQQKRSRMEFHCTLYDHPFLVPFPADTARLAITFSQNATQLEKVLTLLLRPARTLDSTFVPAQHVEHQYQYPFTQSSAQYLGAGRVASDLFQRLHEFSLDSKENVEQLLELESLGQSYLFGYLLTNNNYEHQKFRQVALDWFFSITQLPTEEAFIRLAIITKQTNQETHLTGGRFLLAAARLMEAHEKPASICEDDLEITYRFLCRISDLDPHETRTEVIATLQTIAPATLSRLLAYTQKYSDLLLTSLGLEQAIPLFKFIKKMERANINDAFDIQQANEIMAQAGDCGPALFKALSTSGRYERSLKRLEAIKGIVDANFQTLLLRYSQEHIRLYSLLPVKDTEDLAARYRYFKSAEKEASKMFGRERTANVRDAAQAALNNLAANAGFRDFAAMELAVAARSSEQLQMELELDGYAFSIAIEQHKSVMNISKNGKSLKSIPRTLKKNDALEPILAAFNQLKDQSISYRDSMENLMTQGGWLSPQQLQDVLQLPIAKSILGSLVLRTERGLAGIPSNDFRALLTLDDQLATLTEPVQVAHAIQLLDDGTLAKWQQSIEQRDVHQPFKQIFREYFVATPAEQSEIEQSSRYAGRRVRTRVFGEKLTALGWRFDGFDGECVATKRISPDIVGTLELPDVEHFLTEDEFTELATISFEKKSTTLSLVKVPRVAFSELMRELDLAIRASAADTEEK